MQNVDNVIKELIEELGKVKESSYNLTKVNLLCFELNDLVNVVFKNTEREGVEL